MNQQAYQIEQDRRVLVARPTRGECSGSDIAQLILELRERIDRNDADSVVIELCNVDHMDSACISKLLMLRQRTHAAGGSVALSSCRPNVRFLFEMTKLDKVFGLYDTIEQAVTELRDRRTRKAEKHNPSASPSANDAPRPCRYTPLLNALLRAHRRRFAHAPSSDHPQQDQPYGL